MSYRQIFLKKMAVSMSHSVLPDKTTGISQATHSSAFIQIIGKLVSHKLNLWFEI
jgi:hypothetical protein